MTWEEVIDLAKRVTGERNGIQYKGLSPSSVFRLLNPLSLTSLVEYGTNKNLARERREDLTTVLNTAYEIYSIPGNAPENLESLHNEGAMIEFAQGHVAMLAAINRVSDFGDVNWGVAQYPSYPQAPDTYGAVDAHYHFLLTISEHPEEAFKVMEFFTRPEMQRKLAEAGQFTVLDDVSIMEEFAELSEYTQGIDFSGVFKSRPAPSPILHPSMVEARTIVTDKVIEMLTEGKDVNTAVSEIIQEIDILIQNYEGSN